MNSHLCLRLKSILFFLPRALPEEEADAARVRNAQARPEPSNFHGTLGIKRWAAVHAGLRWEWGSAR